MGGLKARLKRIRQRPKKRSGARQAVPAVDVVARGYVAGTTGFATAFREILLQLERAGISVGLDRATVRRATRRATRGGTGGESGLPLRWREGVVSGRVEISFLPLHRLQPPLESCRHRIVIAEFESMDIPRPFVARIDRYDEVWSPSRHGVIALREAGVRKPVYWMPHGVDIAAFTPGAGEEGEARQPGVGLRALAVGLFEPRKGYDVLFQAVMASLGPGDELTIAGHRSTAAAIHGLLGKYESQYGFSSPNVVVVENELTRAELSALYGRADVFVLPTRGEGDGLPLREALACGVPVVTTDAAPMNESVSRACGFLIDATPREGLPTLFGRSRPYYHRRRFSEPSAEHLGEILKRLRCDIAKLASMESICRSHVLKDRSWESTGAVMSKRIHDVMQ